MVYFRARIRKWLICPQAHARGEASDDDVITRNRRKVFPRLRSARLAKVKCPFLPTLALPGCAAHVEMTYFDWAPQKAKYTVDEVESSGSDRSLDPDEWEEEENTDDREFIVSDSEDEETPSTDDSED